MGFFEPITQEHLRLSAVQPPGDLRDPAWTFEHEGDPGPSVEILIDDPSLFTDDRISIGLKSMRLSGACVTVELHYETPDPGRDLPALSGLWPWVVVSAGATQLNEWEPHLLAGDPADVCRFGAATPSGHMVATGTGFRDANYVFGADDVGSFTSPSLRMLTKASGGGQGTGRATVVLWPPSALDSVDLYFEWPALGIHEVKRRIDAEAVQTARNALLRKESAADAIIRVVGTARGFGLHRDRHGVLTLVIESLTSAERNQIEAAIGEEISPRLGSGVRRLPKRKP